VNEHSFIKAVHRSLPSEVYRWKICDTFTGGVPDAFYAGPAGTIFIEYKYIKEIPKKKTTKIKNTLSSLQKLWLTQMESFDQAVAAVIGVGNNVIVLSNSALWENDISQEWYTKHKMTKTAFVNWLYKTVYEAHHE
jgi:hypothetical protein